ncbi:MAG: amidohydrolase, partial [Bryobacteraceae bacterium]
MTRLLLFSLASIAYAQQPADLILHNAKVVTVDDHFSIASAVVIRGDRILAVGGEDLVAKYKAAKTLDLKGRTVQPGFMDTHIHMHGDPAYYVELSEVKSIQEIRARVAAKAKALPKGAWVSGYGWSEDQLEEKRKPNRQDLDGAAPSNPVVLTRAGGHSSVGNSLALKIAKIDRATPDPDRGAIEHDAAGEPTGVVRERNDVFTRNLATPGRAELRETLTAKLRALFAKGITSIIEASTPLESWPEWQSIYAAHRGELPRAAVQIGWPGAEALQKFGKRTGDGDEFLRLGAIKLFVDGGFTGPAAYTIAPYKGQGDYRGKLVRPEAEFAAIVKQTHALGWQLGMHTIGDGAIQLAANVLAKVLDENPRADHRHYLNHFSMNPPEETYRKIAAHHIWIAQQPNFTYTLEGRYRANLEGERLQRNNPVATPIRHGIFLSLSSDILPIGPLVGLYGAVTRKGMSGEVYGPGERISMAQAITAYTKNGAYFTREEKLKGTIEAGKLADLIVLSGDLLMMDPAKIIETQVDMTILPFAETLPQVHA